MMKTYLVLSNGSIYQGYSKLKPATTAGEVVFSTGMTGYQETITDPSYYGQIMVFTYPLIGNYGINFEDNEKDTPCVSGIIAYDIAEHPSNYRSKMSLYQYAEKFNIPMIEGIDTRELTKELRHDGCIKGVITDNPNDEAVQSLLNKPVSFANHATKETTHIKGDGLKVAVIDYGIKNSIVSELVNFDADVHIFPSDVSAQEIKDINPDGIVLSNGPGDPANMVDKIGVIQELQEEYPIMGICLGNQLLGLANGAKTFKMKFGHRGFNHAVKDLQTNKCYFTSQNHGYALLPESIPGSNVDVIFEEVNDHTVEGIKVKGHNAFSVQFHPDASPGPHDALFIFNKFFNMITKKEVLTNE
ncbi:carbamoyl phosphate synthase small subunit [Apilactobacillus kunkeei]|nr:carbamoyl phosphate synthase small subunit [Apilactobacillus kunkeei]